MRLTARSARVGATLLLATAAIVVARPAAPAVRSAPDTAAPASPHGPSVVRAALAADVATAAAPERDHARSRPHGSSTPALPGIVLAGGALVAWTVVAARRRRHPTVARHTLPGRRAPPLLAV